MHDKAKPERTIGKAVLITVLATAALVALNPPSADGVQSGSPLVLQTTELA
tara:strand:+ start:666 stop:818 length:153 start_codon:yes stop_codon:yes gene_type:complete